MTKLNATINPNRVRVNYDMNRQVKIDVATDLDKVTIQYMDRMFDYYVIDFLINIDSDPRNHKTEETKAKFTLANGIDTITIHHIITDDQYVVWEAIDKALSKDHLASTHDRDGFLQLISYNNYNPEYKRRPIRHNQMVSLPDAIVTINHKSNQSDSASDFADAVALQVQIMADRVSVIHQYYNNDRPWIVVRNATVMGQMLPELKNIFDSDAIITTIIQRYSELFGQCEEDELF